MMLPQYIFVWFWWDGSQSITLYIIQSFATDSVRLFFFRRLLRVHCVFFFSGVPSVTARGFVCMARHVSRQAPELARCERMYIYAICAQFSYQFIFHPEAVNVLTDKYIIISNSARAHLPHAHYGSTALRLVISSHTPGIIHTYTRW